MPSSRWLRPIQITAPCLLAAITTQSMSPQEARAEDSILTIAKDSVYGAATGLLLGGVLALVVDSDHRDDSIRWGVVIGTFAGCGFGIWQVSQPEDFSWAARTSRPDLAVAEDPHPGRRIGDLPPLAHFSRAGLSRAGETAQVGIASR